MPLSTVCSCRCAFPPVSGTLLLAYQEWHWLSQPQYGGSIGRLVSSACVVTKGSERATMAFPIRTGQIIMPSLNASSGDFL